MFSLKKVFAFAVGMFLATGIVLYAQETAQDLTDINVPEQTPGLIDWFLASKAWSVTAFAGIMIIVVQLLKALVAMFGPKLPAKFTPGVVALLGFLSLWEQATKDGKIDGQDWSVLIVSLVGTVAAFFGYKLLFSKDGWLQRK